MFHMRELTQSDLEQFNALLRYAFQVTSNDLVRSGWKSDEFNHAKAPILDGAYVLGWFHKDRLASQIVVYPMRVNIQGEIYDMGGVDTAKVNELYDFIQTRCVRKKFKLILAVFNGTVGKCNENIKVYTDNFPCKNYLYMDKFAKFTKAGYHFEEPFLRFCREEVLEMLEN